MIFRDNLIAGLFAGLLISGLTASPAFADDCGPVPQGMEDLAGIVDIIYEVAGAEGFCPDDLSKPIDLADADARAAALTADDREVAAMFLGQALLATDKTHTQALANGAALLDSLMGVMQSKKEDVSAVVDTLLALAEKTTDPLLRRQIALNLWRRGIKDERVQRLLEEYLPKTPDYAHIFKDGQTTYQTHISTGGDGFKHSDFKKVFEAAGAKVETVNGGPDLKVTYTVKPDNPKLPSITWEISITDDGWPPRDVLDLMANDDMNVGMYANHSQLGTSLDRSLADAPDAPDSTDFMWVDACKSKVFASRLSQAFPKGHFVYTKNSEYFVDMPKAFQRGLASLANHYTYEQMRRYVAAGGLYQGTNYYFPDDAAKLAFQDQDGDGVGDAEDRVYNVEPVGGEPSSRSVHIGNTYAGYSGAYKGSEDKYVPDGIFQGTAGGPSTQITSRKDSYGNTKNFVQVSDQLKSMNETERTALVAHDIAAHWGKSKGWSEDKIKAGSFLVGAAVYDVWGGSGWSTYNSATLPGTTMPLSSVGTYMDEHDFVTDSKLNEFMTFLNGTKK